MSEQSTEPTQSREMVGQCKQHPKYRGARQPKHECLPCWKIWLMQKKADTCLQLIAEVEMDADLSRGCLDMVKGALERVGVDMSGTPPMMYEEAIYCAVAKAKGGKGCGCASLEPKS